MTRKLARASRFPLAGAATDLLFVFIGRIGGITVTLVFIPWYHLLLGGRAFGFFALVLSLQSLFLMFDLGLATLIARDVARNRSDTALLAATIADWRRAELAIIAAMALGIGVVASGSGPGPLANIALAGVIIAAQVALNIAQNGLGALQHYRLNSIVVVGGALLRAAASVLVLTRVEASLAALLLVQAGFSLLQLLAVRWLFLVRLAPQARRIRPRLLDRVALGRLWRDVRLMAAWSLAGALVIQCDKLIVSGWFSIESAGRYFLATTFALTPIAVLGGPLQQYFFPKVVAAGGAASPDADRLAQRFVMMTVLAVTAPSVVLFIHADVWLQLWLHQPAVVAAITPLARLLLAGAAVSALGYYPTARLQAAQRTGFLARLAVTASALTLLAAMAAAACGSMLAIAAVYAAYFMLSAAVLWWAVRLHHLRADYATLVLRHFLGPVMLVLVPVAGFSLATRLWLAPEPAALASVAGGGVWMAVVGGLWWLRYGAGAMLLPPEPTR